MLTPILTLFVGGMVAIIALSVYTPIYGLAQQLK
jgi:type II secretory pathway component PulF